ncbi:MAG: CDP-alcohol phosphatidyltransferase family protein [Anaerolineales bacterium]|nr:CDP-alcohol phosphatidyltransferase family protein [Anaerolineales bacterium]
MSAPVPVPDPAKPRLTPTDWMRRRFKGALDPIAGALIKVGLTPNLMTGLGFLLSVAGAALLSQGWLTWGGLLLLIAGPFDALDGAMARLLGQPTQFGAFVDSVTDRWSEMLVFLGLLYFYLQRGDSLACILVLVATMGSVMVSYTKARGEALGFDVNVGVLTRMERYLVLAPLLVLNLPLVALWIVAVLANVTALQRALHVRRQSRQK